jgi:hypothetical protein
VRSASPALAVLALAAASADAAEPLHFPAVIGEDDRRTIASDGPPWEAIGRITHSGYRTRGLCTGTLVAPRSSRRTGW